MMFPDSPKALAFDGTLVAWVTWVLVNGVTELIAVGTLVLIILRIAIAVKELKR